MSDQLGLFGAAPSRRDVHVVSAHQRTLADGTDVFVGEHVRWSRGRHVTGRRETLARRGPAPPPPAGAPSRDQLGLFVASHHAGPNNAADASASAGDNVVNDGKGSPSNAAS